MNKLTESMIYLVPLRPDSRPIRTGHVAQTEETIKAEIAGLPCHVKSEDQGMARVYVLKNGKYEGPFTLRSSEVI